jgi:DNA-directed RNA polymerase specialized sigma24 family protein
MHEFAERLAGAVLSGDETAADLACEFEARLADCGRLAVRVAYSVVRHHQDAEDVAQ